MEICQSYRLAEGYNWNLKLYTGQDLNPTTFSGASTKVVMDMNQDFWERVIKIFIDNWYSTPDLFLQVLDAQTNICGIQYA